MLTEQEKGIQRQGEVRNSKQRRIYMPVCILSHFSHVWLSATPWTVARQAPLFMGFPRQEYWSWLPCPPLGDLPNWGIKPKSLMSPALAGEFFTTSATWEAPYMPIIPQIKKKKKGRMVEGDTLSSEANNLSVNLIESRAWGRDWRADTLDGRKI